MVATPVTPKSPISLPNEGQLALRLRRCGAAAHCRHVVLCATHWRSISSKPITPIVTQTEKAHEPMYELKIDGLRQIAFESCKRQQALQNTDPNRKTVTSAICCGPSPKRKPSAINRQRSRPVIRGSMSVENMNIKKSGTVKTAPTIPNAALVRKE